MQVLTTAPLPPHRCGERVNRLDMWVSMLWVRSQMQVCCCLDGERLACMHALTTALSNLSTGVPGRLSHGDEEDVRALPHLP